MGGAFTGRRADASTPSHAYTRAWPGYKSRRPLLTCAHTSPALYLFHAAAQPLPPPLPSPPSPAFAMAERFPGDTAAANGFVRRSLRKQESWLLYQANIPAPSDMRARPTGW